MPDRQRLLDEEETGAAAFDAVLARIPDHRWDEPAIPPDGWSPVVLLEHMAWWLDECGRVLEAMAAGTWEPDAESDETPESVAAANAKHAARAAALTRSGAEEAVAAARARARVAWTTLPELTRDAWSWFEESGPNHYAKHVHDLTAWLADTTSDPAVGELLQQDAEAWVPFARLLEAIDPAALDDEGWSTAHVCHHVAAWMDVASDAIEVNEGWSETEDVEVDTFNARTMEGARGIALGEARVTLEEARARLRAALTSLAAPSDGAKEAFFSSTVEHYEEHLPMLERLNGSAGSVP